MILYGCQSGDGKAMAAAERHSTQSVSGRILGQQKSA
jgi:hypothetical protein